MKKKQQTEAERQRLQKKEQARRYRAADPERAREINRRWRERQKEKVRAQVEMDRASVAPIYEALDFEGIKALAKKLHRSAESLIALTGQHDPFYLSPRRIAAAEWFTKIWKRLKFGSGIHVRQIHYVLVSQDPPQPKPDGTPYHNTWDDYMALGQAVRDARYLGLIPSDYFVDRRNDEPIIHLSGAAESAADLWVSSESPGIETTAAPAMPDLPSLYLSEPAIPQRYHVELWAEKTTANSVLEPLAQRYGCNLVTGSGELSLTACEDAMERVVESDRPVRVLYISDFDPTGRNIPVSVARKIEYRFRRNRLEGLDIQVRQIVLTPEQCERYRLPRTPLKPTDRRANRFEAQFGAGATELDALEALHPGELRRIVEAEIRRYYDNTLRTRISRTALPFERSILALNQEVRDRHQREINKLESEWGDIASDHETAIEEWVERADVIWDAITEELEANKPDLDAVEWPEPEEGDEDEDPLFDSTRDYVTQIDRYKRHQGKPAGNRSNGLLHENGAFGDDANDAEPPVEEKKMSKNARGKEKPRRRMRGKRGGKH